MGTGIPSEQYLGRIDLGVNDTKYPMTTQIDLAKMLVKEFKRMGLSIA